MRIFGKGRMVSVLLTIVLVLGLFGGNRAEAASSDDRYTSYNASSILKRYCIFVEQNLSCQNHIIGAIAVGGTYTNGNFFGDVMTFPSYIKNWQSGGLGNGAVDNSLINYLKSYGHSFGRVVYYGTKSVADSGENIIQNPNYINMSSAFSSLRAQSKALAERGSDILSGNTLDLTNVNSDVYVTIPSSKLNTLNIKIPGYSWFRSHTLVISVTGGSIDFNGWSIKINGSDIGNSFRGSFPGASSSYGVQLNVTGMNLFWNFPDAKTVKAQGFAGHMIAPNAAVTNNSGNFEGGIIAKSFNCSSEAHFYPCSRSLPKNNDDLKKSPPSPTQKTEIPSPTQKTEIPSPTQKVDTPSPTQKTEIPSPTQKTEKPSPTQKVTSPSPTKKVDTPSPTQKTEKPSPTQKTEIPSPTQKQATPSPTQKPATPSPTQKVATPTPTESLRKKVATPTPTESLRRNVATPTPTTAAATPTQKIPTPTQKVTVPTPTQKAEVPTPTGAAAPTQEATPTPTVKVGTPTPTPYRRPTATPRPKGGSVNDRLGEAKFPAGDGHGVFSKQTTAGAELEGAELSLTCYTPGIDLSRITRTAESGGANYRATKTQITWTSTSERTVLQDLPNGTYRLHEDCAPANYDCASDIYFTMYNGVICDINGIPFPDGVLVMIDTSLTDPGHTEVRANVSNPPVKNALSAEVRSPQTSESGTGSNAGAILLTLAGFVGLGLWLTAQGRRRSAVRVRDDRKER